MKRLTEKDDKGNWCLKGVRWANLRAGSVLSRETAERLVGALWKLMDYEETDMEPKEIELRISERDSVIEHLVELRDDADAACNNRLGTYYDGARDAYSNAIHVVGDIL